MKKEILYQLHDSPMTGEHFSVEKTLARIKQRVCWPSFKVGVEKHTASCDRRMVKSSAGTKQRAELQTFTVHRLFEAGAAVILGPVKLAKKFAAR